VQEIDVLEVAGLMKEKRAGSTENKVAEKGTNLTVSVYAKVLDARQGKRRDSIKMLQ